MTSALGNLKVLDFSRVLAGPLTTMVLADLGATVTKVESPAGDDTRGWGPPYDENGMATYFQSVNRNKDSLVLDLAEPGDLERARGLALAADVLVENFRPGVMAKFGLDYERLHELNPGLIYCSITGFGRGAGATLPGYDLLIQALGGLMSITGESGGEPQKVGVALVDVLAGLYATIGILAALEHRRDTGEGQLVEVELLTALLAGLVNQSSAYTLAGVVAGRMGNQHPSIAPYRLLRTAEGDLVIAVGTDRQFAALCEVVGASELAEGPQVREQHGPRRASRPAQRGARAAARHTLGSGMGRRADRGPRPGRRRQRHRRRVRPRPGPRAGAGRRDSPGGRDDRGADPQSDPPVGDAADVPLGPAAARGAEAAR